MLDYEKHYYVGEAEIEKLLAKGEPWLKTHPEREFVVSRFLRHDRGLIDDALERLLGDEDPDPSETLETEAREEQAIEEKNSLDEQRRAAVIAVLKAAHAASVVDLGCGEGKLLRDLLHERIFARIVGFDVSPLALERAARRLRLDQLSERERARIDLIQGSLGYRDQRIAGFDAAVIYRPDAFVTGIIGSSGHAASSRVGLAESRTVSRIPCPDCELDRGGIWSDFPARAASTPIIPNGTTLVDH